MRVLHDNYTQRFYIRTYNRYKQVLLCLKGIVMIKKLLYIFVLAFVLNFVWENAHSLLYFHPDGEPITQLILLQATLFDAVFITLMGVLFLSVPYFKQRLLFYSLLFGVIVAVVIEFRALEAGRWASNELMPIVPLLKTGLTPTIQLGLLSYITYRFVFREPTIKRENV